MERDGGEGGRLRRNVFAKAKNADRVNLSTMAFGRRNMIMYVFVGPMAILTNQTVIVIELLYHHVSLNTVWLHVDRRQCDFDPTAIFPTSSEAALPRNNLHSQSAQDSTIHYVSEPQLGRIFV